MSSNLIAEAIADAKAVRATALQNAKSALEEAFSTKVREALSEKLKEEIRQLIWQKTQLEDEIYFLKSQYERQFSENIINTSKG